MENNKFISRDTLRKRKARENETPSQRETRLEKQHEYKRQKRAREDAKEKEVHAAHDKERKHVKLVMETDEQREKRLNYYRERRTYLKNIDQNQNQELNSQQK